MRRLLVVAIAAASLVLAAPAAADYWGESDFTVTWPSSGRSAVLTLTAPADRVGVSVAVDGHWLYPGRWYALTCPTFAIRSSFAGFTYRYSPGAVSVYLTLRQGAAAWACFSGYPTGTTSEVAIRTWRP